MPSTTTQNESTRGEHLRLLREASGIKQAELAARLGIQPSVLSRRETGELPLSDGDYKQIYSAIVELRKERNATFERLRKSGVQA